MHSVVTLLRLIGDSVVRRDGAGHTAAMVAPVGLPHLFNRPRRFGPRARGIVELQEIVREHDRKTALLYTASHEVRGSIHGIFGLVEHLRESAVGTDSEPLLNALSDACSGLRATVQQVLDVAQLEFGVGGADPCAFDLRAVLREVTAVVRGSASGDVTVSLTMDESCEPMRFGNSGRVNQILTNVALNGAKAMVSGDLAMEVHAGGDDIVRFVIRDQGRGMPVSAQDRLTGLTSGPRRRATDVTSDPAAGNERGGPDPSVLRRGNGLGLLIARELVELLGGRVEVSVQWGAGTRVLIELPLPCVQVGSTPAAEPEVHDVIARALIVDDAPDGLEFLSRSMKQISEHVDATVDSSEALVLAARSVYDLVIVDGMMSPHDGADLARAMRRFPTTRDSVIIVATGNVETVSASRYLAAGADLVLVKPFSKLELVRAVRRARTARDGEALSAVGEGPGESSSIDRVIDLRGPISALDTGPRAPRSIFEALLKERVAAIVQAHERGDAEAFGRSVHALGSPAVMLGFDGLGRYCLALETISRSLGMDGISPAAVEQLALLATMHHAESMANH